MQRSSGILQDQCNRQPLSRGVQPFSISRPHWKKSCFGPHIKYIATHNHKKSHNVLSKFTILCWATFTAILACTAPQAVGWTPLHVFQQWETPLNNASLKERFKARLRLEPWIYSGSNICSGLIFPNRPGDLNEDQRKTEEWSWFRMCNGLERDLWHQQEKGHLG